MHVPPGSFVYLIQSTADATQWYVGLTSDVSRRLTEHNEGRSPHTAKHRPWKLALTLSFADPYKALAFEKYLKSGSGRAFAIRHFR